MSRTLSAVILLLLIFYIPFLNKAVHNDDGNFIEMSKAIDFPFSVKPGYVYYWMGQKTENYNPFGSSHPPFIPYYLKLISTLTGGYAEYSLHGGYLLFAALFLWATILLAKELSLEPVPAAMIICCNVGLLPASHTLHADAAMLALWILAAYLMISGVRGDSEPRIVLSVVALSIACLIAYQTFLILPAFFLFFWLSRRQNRRSALVLAVPVLAVSVVLLYLMIRYPFALFAIVGEIKLWALKRLLMKGVSIPVNIGVSMLFPVLLGYGEAFGSKRGRWLAAASVLAAMILVLSLSYPLWNSLWLIFLASTGIFSVLYAFTISVAKREDRNLNLFLLAWITIVILYNLFVLTFGALRYVMPAVVPLSVIFMKDVLRGKKLIMAGALTALLGLAVAYGDYIYASSYRDFAEEVAGRVGSARERVWYTGECGMHYYMDKEGFRYLTSKSNQPVQGDLVITASVPNFWQPSPELIPRLKLIDVVEVKTWYPVKVLGQHMRAGYYSTAWGYLPFTISDDYIEKFGIFSVAR